MDDHPTADEGPEDFAGEMALGLIDGRDWTEAMRQAQVRPELAQALADWEIRLAPLALLADEVAPRRDLWPEIKARLPANDTKPPEARELIWWRASAIGLGAVAAGFAAIAVLNIRPATISPAPNIAAQAPPVATLTEPMQVALLAPHSGPTAFVATLDRDRKRMTISPGALHARRGHDLELWMIPPNGAPQPLGVIPADRSASMPMPDAFAGTGTTPIVLAVSVEPLGGAPDGKPTGPVIATGRFQAV